MSSDEHWRREPQRRDDERRQQDETRRQGEDHARREQDKLAIRICLCFWPKK
jgi:hypothetical protein